MPSLLGAKSLDAADTDAYFSLHTWKIYNARRDVSGVVGQRIREYMTLRFQKQEVGSWKLEVVFSQLVHW